MHGNIAERSVDDNSPLGRLFRERKISEAEYQAGVRWREVCLGYLASIESPSPYGGDTDEMSDERCADYAENYLGGVKLLQSLGKRVLHAVAAIVVYEEPEELGDFGYTASAAQVGLARLAKGY